MRPPSTRSVLLGFVSAALAACTVERGGQSATDSAATTTRGAGGEVDDISVPFDSAQGTDVVVAPDVRGDTGWMSAARGELMRRRPGAAVGNAPLPGAVAGDSLATLTPQRVNTPARAAAFGGEGATVLRAQILLDRAGYSSGAIDGRWGGNTGKAAFWFQDAHGLPPTGAVDAATFQRLEQLVGRQPALVQYTVTAEDLAGPFVPVAASPYAQARQDCLCYESAWELLAERFHTTRELLARLNAGSDTTRAPAAGLRLWAPNVARTGGVPLVSAPRPAGLADLAARDAASRFALAAGGEPALATPAGVATRSAGDSAGGATARRDSAPAGSGAGTSGIAEEGGVRGLDAAALAAGDSAAGAPARDTSGARAGTTGVPGRVARVVISNRGSYLHALDAQGRVVYHAPSTLGSTYDPSPQERLTVTRVVFYPSFHYNPKLYADVPDSRADANLPPGPNSPVGIVWMALSKPHYGIHGTKAPTTIGYADSHGCVRLTNWDARWLAENTPSGTPVEFHP